MGTDLKTLFHHAPSEMSHSGFWAWFFECHKAATGPRAALCAAASELIADLSPANLRPREGETGCIFTEEKNGGVRYDLVLDFPRFAILIETKVWAAIDATQLKRYQAAQEGTEKPTSFIVMSLAFDDDARPSIPDRWRYFGLDEMLRWLAPTAGKHAITDEYLEYLDGEQDERERLERNAFSPCKAAYKDALSTERGQWAWMRQFAKSAGLVGWPLRGRNRDGTPWTQYWIDGKPDDLFFRLDRAKSGFYLALLQHEKGGFSQPRREALANLRVRWSEAADAAGIDMKMSRLTRGRMNMKIAQYDFAENGGPDSVGKDVSKIFETFIEKTPEYSMASRTSNLPVRDTR